MNNTTVPRQIANSLKDNLACVITALVVVLVGLSGFAMYTYFMATAGDK